MFGSVNSGAKAYTKVAVETGVMEASPHQLITMLFDGAMIALGTALQHMRGGNIPGKGKAISQAIMIIDNGLKASLDKKVGGEIAVNLDALYEYMSKRLIIANLKNQPEIIEEVYGLLKDLKLAWDAIGVKAAPASEEPLNAPSYDPLAPHSTRLAKA
ncbi:flagellar export chaperone FliS [soil metagenome]